MTQPLDGTGAFIANHSVEWSRSQTASAATPHSGRDQSPVHLLWSLCHYSRHCVDMRRAVRTRLTPHDHCAIKSLYFLLCRTLGGHGQRPSNTVRPLTGMRPPSVAPSAPRLAKREGQRALQPLPRRLLTPQDRDTSWAQSKNFHGLRPHPAPCSTVLGNRNHQLFSPVSGRKGRLFRSPVHVTRPSLSL